MHHREDGAPSHPPLILGPSLGTPLAVWEQQTGPLARTHRVIRFDLPGHGGSSPGLLQRGGTVADLGGRVLELADSLGIDRFAYAGISLGGAVGIHLAARHPDRVSRLAVVCSSARFGGPDGWHERARTVRAAGTGPLAPGAAERWFTPAFAREPAATALLDALRSATDPEAYARLCEALAVYDARGELGRIAVPTLVVAGREDPATPVDHARELADAVPGAGLVEIPRAAHLAGVEQPRVVTSALLAHFTAGGDDGSRHAAGLAVRRKVLGDAHVDRALARTTPLTAAFQDFITRYAWGEIWSRPGLDHRTRRCLTLTALVALNHHAELEMHLRAALTSGDLSPDDVREVLLQSAVYCGVPSANAAFALAERVLAETAAASRE
ncbi:4-carboxymuconolactone decarboxylase [Streptomyces sp. WAC08241]|uniref:bifunctional 3-oxoadipate enol-lactonase/4-carboxymuconolactone decarboxylase PcaDC n=1 Tax=Streptomyces sp. WAC08241 TaxID=2487421 RepID=UPI000F77069F|nr:4-carboxymuconolactone decarboxylase [Streptomyces sp. WAC08241]